MKHLRKCAAWRPRAERAHEPEVATKIALKRLAHRVLAFKEEIAGLDECIRPIVERAAPALLELEGVGIAAATDLLAAVGENPDWMRSEGSFAMMCGASLIPASSGEDAAASPESGREPKCELGVASDRADSNAHRSENAALRRAAHGRGAVEARGDAVPRAVHGPSRVPGADERRRGGERDGVVRCGERGGGRSSGDGRRTPRREAGSGGRAEGPGDELVGSGQRGPTQRGRSGHGKTGRQRAELHEPVGEASSEQDRDRAAQ